MHDREIGEFALAAPASSQVPLEGAKLVRIKGAEQIADYGLVHATTDHRADAPHNALRIAWVELCNRDFTVPSGTPRITAASRTVYPHT